MRVSIEHHQIQTGLFSRKTHYAVSVSVEFNNEEKHVIRSLKNVIILDRGPDSQRQGKFSPEEEETLHSAFCLKLSDLGRKKDTYAFAAASEAKQYDAELREALANLKTYIENNATAPAGTDTFEL